MPLKRWMNEYELPTADSRDALLCEMLRYKYFSDDRSSDDFDVICLRCTQATDMFITSEPKGFRVDALRSHGILHTSRLPYNVRHSSEHCVVQRAADEG